MLREKDLPGGPLFSLARNLDPICAEAGAPLLINDRLDVALALERAGVHLGRGSVPVAEARRLLGDARLVGYSAHEADEAYAALAAGADYVTLSPIFPSVSKPGLEPRGIELIDAALAAGVPAERLVALGGVTADTVGCLAARGLGGAAVLGAVVEAEAPGRVARILAEAWRAAGGLVPPIETARIHQRNRLYRKE